MGFQRVISLTAVLVASTALIPGAGAKTNRDADLYNPQQVADATFPSTNAFWRRLFANNRLAYRAARYYWWYNKPGNRRWIPIARRCDNYQTKGDGRMWGGRSREYRPNSFYCPLNEQIYLDWTFFQTIGFRTTRKWGRGDDARVALVIAHEYAHHVQRVLRYPERKRRAGQYARFELHADCFAGAWFDYGERTGLIERADTLNANTLLGYLGDADRTPWNEPSAHGGHSDRQEWFLYGYETANPRNCDRVFR